MHLPTNRRLKLSRRYLAIWMTRRMNWWFIFLKKTHRLQLLIELRCLPGQCS